MTHAPKDIEQVATDGDEEQREARFSCDAVPRHFSTRLYDRHDETVGRGADRCGRGAARSTVRGGRRLTHAT
jgi:hypothetical protein